MAQNHLNHKLLCFLWCLQLTCSVGALLVLFYPKMAGYLVVSATKTSHLATHPLRTGHTLLQILSMLDIRKEVWATCPRAPQLPHLGMRSRSYQFSHPHNEIKYHSPFLFILMHFQHKARNIFESEVKSLRVNEEDHDCYHATCILYEESPSAATYQNWIDKFKRWKKRNCSPVIMKTEAGIVNKKQQALDLNTLLS